MAIWQSLSVTELESTGRLLIQDGNHGNDRPRPDEFVESGTAFVRAADLRRGQVDFVSSGKITPEAVARIRKGKGLPGDVLLSHKGTVGKVAIAPADSPAFVCSPQTTFWRSLDAQYLDHRYLRFFMESPAFVTQLDARKGESDMAPYVSLTEQRKLKVVIPPLQEQVAIAEVLGALDDKITANQKLSGASASLGRAMFDAAVRADPEEWLLSEITVLVTRGVTPTYSEADDTMMVLNQKCVRDQRVVLDAARRTLTSKVREDKILVPNDVLINSTGQGTLGRVARWTHNELATTDSHISIVRFDGAKTNKVVAGHGLLQLQSVIEEMGEGSTGQTELSRTELNKLRIRLPSSSEQEELGLRLSELARMEDSSLHQNLTLAATRDALLPPLVSGKLRVKDAESVVEGVL